MLKGVVQGGFTCEGYVATEAASLETAPMTEISREDNGEEPCCCLTQGPDATFFSSSYTMNWIAPWETCIAHTISVSKISASSNQ